MQSKIEYIADHYGLRHQCMKLLEEMGELTVEVTKYLLSAQSDSVSHVPIKLQQELADVNVLVEQVKYLVNTEYVNCEMERKIERQLGRMKSEQTQMC